MQATPSDGWEDETPEEEEADDPVDERRRDDRGDDAAALPPVVRVRTQATVRGRDAVVVRFGTGARLRYVEVEDAVREEWFRPAADEPARTVERPDADRAELALNAVGEYLTFDGRDRAAFVWGEQNVEVVTGR